MVKKGKKASRGLGCMYTVSFALFVVDTDDENIAAKESKEILFVYK